jgi:hypothetical protein
VDNGDSLVIGEFFKRAIGAFDAERFRGFLCALFRAAQDAVHMHTEPPQGVYMRATNESDTDHRGYLSHLSAPDSVAQPGIIRILAPANLSAFAMHTTRIFSQLLSLMV